MQAVLDELAGLGPKPIETLTPAEARKQPGPADAVKSLLKKRKQSAEPEAVGGVKDVKFPSGKVELPACVYTPKGDGPFPVLVYWHGGGFVLADLDTYDASCRTLCNAANCLVVSCHYRHAPEHPHPAQGEDAFAAYQWVLKSAGDWKGDPKRVAVGGESAGGALAAGVAIQARNRKATVPVYQLPVYPVTDNALDTDSYKTYADAKPLNKPMMRWFFAHTLGNQTAEQAKPAFALKADLAGLPPATVITAEIDPLRDDGKRVLCEKPMAASMAECEQMIAAAKAAKAAKRKLMVAYRLRYEPFNIKPIEVCRGGEIGKVKIITASHCQNVEAPNIRLSKELAGGPVEDVGIYCLNACRYLTGEDPTEVTAVAQQPKDDPRFREVPESVLWTLRFPSGIVANCDCSFGTTKSAHYRVLGDQGHLEMDPAFTYFGLKMNVFKDGRKSEFSLKETDHFAADMDHFSECVLADKPPRTPGEEGLADMRVIAAIAEAVKTGKTVSVRS